MEQSNVYLFIDDDGRWPLGIHNSCSFMNTNLSQVKKPEQNNISINMDNNGQKLFEKGKIKNK